MSIYKGKLFKFNHSFAWKSLRQSVFQLCSSEIKITYILKLLLVFIWITTEEKQFTSYYKQEDGVWIFKEQVI